MLKRLIILGVAASFVGWRTVQPQAPAPPAKTPCCEPPPDPQEKDLLVDAMDASVKGKLNYGLHDRVRVAVKNVNPFLYDYRILTSESRYPDLWPGEFFKLALGADLAKLRAQNEPIAGESSDAPGKTTAPDKTTKDVKAADPCQEVSDAVAKARNELQALVNDEHRLDRALQSAGNAILEPETPYQQYVAIVRAESSTPDEIMPAAGAAEIALNATIKDVSNKLGNLPDQLLAFEQKVKDFDSSLSQIVTKGGLCGAVVSMRGTLRNIAADTITLRANYKLVESWLDDATKTAKSLRRGAHQKSMYYKTLSLGRHSDPTDVNVRVLRKYTTDDTTQFVSVVQRSLNFGGYPRFSFGAGVAWTDLPTRDYKTATQVIPAFPGRPGDTTITVVVVKEESHNRVVPVVTLNTRLSSADWPVGVHATLGSTIYQQGSATNLEFLLGGAFSLFDTRLMLVGGAYAGRTTLLAGDLAINSQVPAGSEIPKRTLTAFRPGFALTYRIK